MDELLEELSKCDKILTSLAGRYYSNDPLAWRGTVSERLSYITDNLIKDVEEGRGNG